jgi:hypothetical protein
MTCPSGFSKTRGGPTRAARGLLAVLALVALSPISCVTREVREAVFSRSSVEVSLREHRRLFTTIPRGFAHPAHISPERLSHILGAIDIRGREEQLAGIRAAFEPTQLPDISEAVSYGLSQANPDQELAVRITSKVVQHGIFNRKFMTSFVAYVENDLLYLHISRVDWPLPKLVKKTAPPEPRVDEHPMKFKVVPVDGMYAEGVYAVSVDWQDPIFGRPLRDLGKETGRRKRTILMEEPDLPERRRPAGISPDTLSRLTAEQYRQLADLEDARQQGRLTEGHYRRERQKILDTAGEESGSSD